MDGYQSAVSIGAQTPDEALPPLQMLSLFSGIEAASLAAAPLGWRTIGLAEIDPAACHLLHQNYGCGRPLHLPDPARAGSPAEAARARARCLAVANLPVLPRPGCAANLGDITLVDWATFAGLVDIMVGGPPCVSFSMAGLRASLADARGGLSLGYAAALRAVQPAWSLTENVPGWLSTADNAFGYFLAALVGARDPLPPPRRGSWGTAGLVEGPLYRAAWRVLDAQGFLPQRRRRVLVLAARADTPGDPAAALFETEAEVHHNLGARAADGELFPPVTEDNPPPLAFSAKDHGADAGIVAPTLRAAPHHLSHPNSGSHVAVCLASATGGPGQLRRLTPEETLALQGFPPDYLDAVTLRGKPLAEGHRYRLCGNSWAVPLIAWVFRRIEAQRQMR